MMKISSIITLVITLIFSFISLHGFTQDDEDECWCKEVTVSELEITVKNVSLEAAIDTIFYPTAPQCSDDACENSLGCLWEEMVGGTPVTKYGECTDEVFPPGPGAGGLGLSGDGNDDNGTCDCTETLEVDGIVVFRNVSKLAESGEYIDSEYFGLVRYEIEDEADDCSREAADCIRPSSCFFRKWNKNPKTGEWGYTYSSGICLEWPKIKDARMALDQNEESPSEEIKAVTSLSFFPNPAANEITVVSANDSEGTIMTQILNLSGELILESTEKKINIQALASGTYVVQMHTQNTTVRELLIVQ